MSKRFATSRLPAALLAAGLLAAGSACAAARTYVASYGSDANTATNCAPTAPCRTFAAAMTVADTGGEIIVLDSAGYGSATITKSLAIIAPDGIYAGLTAVSGSVVTIATAGVAVTLKGLTIKGGDYGIRMTNGANLHVENCEIAGAAIRGIEVQTPARVRVANSTVRDNAWGIASGSGATVDVMNSHIANNGSEGIAIYAGTAETTTINVSDSVVTGSTFCIDNYPAGSATGIMNVTRSTVTGCSTWGIGQDDGGTQITTVSNSMVTRNGNGFYNFDGSFYSLGNNHVRQNSTNKFGTITVVTQD